MTGRRVDGSVEESSRCNIQEKRRDGLKLACIGAGNVGASAAQSALAAGVSDIVLVDIVPGVPEGKALDLA